MPLTHCQCDIEDQDGHHYRLHRPSDIDDFLSDLAGEYVRLGSRTRADLSTVSLEGLDEWDTGGLRARISQASIPAWSRSPLNVLRSDFGEMVLYRVVEQELSARIGYKSLVDRELTDLPGRGIDAVGVNADSDSGKIRLVLGEAKVSDDRRTPTPVVDRNRDALSKQHVGQLKHRQKTADRIIHQARHIDDAQLLSLVLSAALLLETGAFDRLDVIVCAVLVRSAAYSNDVDYGSYRATPSKFTPASISFHRFETAQAVESVVEEWSRVIERVHAA